MGADSARTDGPPAGDGATAAPARLAAAAASGAAAGRRSVLPAPPGIVEGLRKTPRDRALPRLGLFSDMPDRGLFILFVTLGFALIFGVKTILWRAGIEYDWSIAIAAGAALLMLIYGILAYRVPAVRLRPDRLGDNFYYMGFVFTLASMSAALVQLQSGREVDALIGSFGIALFSTILGIAGRVAFIQMRTEVEDIEERVRQDLLDAAQLLRGQLGVAARDLESFRVGIQQAVHERLSESAEGFGQLADALSRLADRLTESVDHLGARIEAIEVPPSLLEAKIDPLVARLGETAAAFERVAQADSERHQDLAAAGVDLRRVVGQIAKQLGKLQSTAEKLDTAADPAAQVTESLSRVKEALDAAVGATRALVDSAVAARQASGELTGSIKAYGEMVAGVTQAQQASAAAAAADMEATRRRMASELEESRAAVAEVQKALADTARVVAQALSLPAAR